MNPQEILQGRRAVGFRVEADREMIADLARRHPRMWIVAAAPIGVEARHALLRQASGAFREVAGAGFGYVSVFRWDSDRASSGSR
jgi:hypothetical protein